MLFAMNERSLLSRLDLSPERISEIRCFLVPLWIQWGVDRGKPVSAAGEEMCRFTSAFLVKVLGPGWRFDGGHPDVFDWKSKAWVDSGLGGGFLDASGVWRPHHWVCKNGVIVDLTASQFGEPDMVITTSEDPRFRSTMDSRSRAEALRDVQARASAWASDWRSALREGSAPADRARSRQRDEIVRDNTLLSDDAVKASVPADVPEVLFHGTSASFESFAPNPSGIFFTEDLQTAQAYALGHDNDAGARVIAVRIRLENPLVTSSEWLANFEREHVSKDTWRSVATISKTFEDAFVSSEPWARKLVAAEARRLGHDGMILPADDSPEEHMAGDWATRRAYVVFDPSHIEWLDESPVDPNEKHPWRGAFTVSP